MKTAFCNQSVGFRTPFSIKGRSDHSAYCGTRAGRRNAELSPGCALLFLAAEHPVRIKAIDYETRRGFYVPGLKCLDVYAEKKLLNCVLGLDFDRKESVVRLFPWSCEPPSEDDLRNACVLSEEVLAEIERSSFAVPEFVK